MRYFTFFFLLLSCSIDAQNDSIPSQATRQSDSLMIFDTFERMAQFPGGELKMIEWISQNTYYPALARENNVHGRVILAFVVEKNGSIKNIEVLHPLGSGCTEEALKMMKKMPKWTPATLGGKPIRQRYTVPVFFKLRSSQNDEAERIAYYEGGEEAIRSYFQSKISKKTLPKAKKRKPMRLKLHITEEGSVEKVEIMQSSGVPFFDKKIKTLASDMHWMPALKNGALKTDIVEVKLDL